MKMMVAVARDGTDRFPVFLRVDCDRTVCDWRGKSEALIDVIKDLDRHGYDLVSYEEAAAKLVLDRLSR